MKCKRLIGSTVVYPVVGLAFLAAGFDGRVAHCHAQATPDDAKAPWTLLIYGGVDSSSEEHLMPHLRLLAAFSSKGQKADVLLLIDRAAGFSDDAETLGENFEDTRLFRLRDGQWQRISGAPQFPEISLQSSYEANTGEADTLKKFIGFGKAVAPAEKYALVIFGHGDCRSVCPDLSSPCEERDEFDDPLYVAEMTGQMSDRESVDLIWFDVCSFGCIENAYQLRPAEGKFSASAMLATPPLSTPAPMAQVLEAAGILGESIEQIDMPADGVSFGRVAVEAIEKNTNRFKGYKDAWSCYDLTAAQVVKHAVDRLAVALAESDAKEIAERIRGEGNTPQTLNYMHRSKGSPRMWVVSPHFDVYDLAQRFSESQDVSADVRSRAGEVLNAVERLVIASFAGRMYREFQRGKHGIYLVFPDGDGDWRGKSQWSTFQWYHPGDRSQLRYSFGKYDWCSEGATPGNDTVENWFELMDCWFDTNDANGGVNDYRW